jgi:hypothetical protein
MAITNGYTTLNEYKQRFYDEGTGDTKDDAAIESVITAVSRAIDNICQQRFFTTAAVVVRYYTADQSDYLRLPERINLVSQLKTDNDNDRVYENTWDSATDYDLLPHNAELAGEPWRWIEAAPNGDYSFPVGVSKGVYLSGKFGWATAPQPIVEACLLSAHRLMARRHSPLGVSGAAAVGNLTLTVKQMKSDPDIMELLSYYTIGF